MTEDEERRSAEINLKFDLDAIVFRAYQMGLGLAEIKELLERAGDDAARILFKVGVDP